MSAMEVPEGSMSRMAEENISEEKVARVSFLQQLCDRISSPPISELLGRLKVGKGLLKTLKTNLQRLDAILDDAESKAYEGVKLERPLHRICDQIKDQIKVGPWLDALKEVGYDLEDLLDEIATERLRHQFESKPGNIETYLKKTIFPNIRDQLKGISSRIIALLQKSKGELGLSEASRILRKPYPLSAAKLHLEDESQVRGRDKDKEAIIELLLSDNETGDPVTVIPVVGADGVGKTTLARLVYNDYRVSKQFDLKGWASLPQGRFVDESLIIAFSEAFSIVDSRNIGVKLNKILNMKKFLLVLDNVPYPWYWNPKEIHTYLSKGAKGSKILLTTRLFRRGDGPKWVLPDYDLKPLNSEGSWILFVKHAFADKDIGLHPRLEAIGKSIVTKCDGLPLLIVTLGAMLRFKPSVEDWEAVLRKLSDLHAQEDIVSILLISYDSLPPNLKRCFAYCSIFPEDHEYDKEKLVLLWMAEGFLQHSKHRRIEEVGHEYFDDLISRSFFQKSGANGSRFVMHSRLHELAQLVSGEFCSSLINELGDIPSDRVRYLSFSKYSRLWLYNSHLRTVLQHYLPPGERSIDSSHLFFDQIKDLPCLRVLSFSDYTITMLPDSIEALKLLQYLDLSRTRITRLPNIVTTFYNLQTLLLSYCHLLSKLPKEFWKLVYLRHLDIRETCLEEMPTKMGCLTSLQSLSDFVVGKYSGSNIRELGPLKNLRGTLCISQLQNVTSARDASEANLKDKADLKVLELKWSDATANSQRATNVLEKLEPHQNLEKLSIISYKGISFPDWVGDSSFSKMLFLHLSDCNSCSQLPPLGQLPSLKELIIEGMRGVKKIGPEFFGVNNVSANPFPSLEILVFREMPEWEGWIASEMQPIEFPRLKRMCIKSCPKYENHLSLCLSPLVQVEISVSEETSILPTLPELAVEKQLNERDKVPVRGKEKQQDRPSTAGLLEVEEPQLPNSIVWQRIDVSITSNRPPQGSLQHLREDERRKNVSTMEIVKGSMSLMAEENLSEEKMAQASILQQLYGRISSVYITKFFGELILDAALLDNLKSNLPSLDVISDDAESKAYEDKKVEEWFGDLKAFCYDLEDLLDEIASKRVHYQLEFMPLSIKTRVQRIISPIIGDQLEKINIRMTSLLRCKHVLHLSEASHILREPYSLSAVKAGIEDECQVYGRDKDKEVLGLSEASWMMREPYLLSAAKDLIEDECQVCGRDEDKNAIIELLLSDNETDDCVTVVSIVGEEGVGKTTLAQLVYNNYRVSEQFDLKGWASLSPYLPSDEGLIKAFSEAYSIVDSRNIGDKLNKILNMKKFLLVLDDVPYSWYWDWEKIPKGAKGSKILLTAWHSVSIGKSMHYYKDYDLKPLNSDSSWMLLVKHAFADKEVGLHPGLEAIGKNIVTKCDNLPLLIVALGAMLRFKPSVEEWEAVLRKLPDLKKLSDFHKKKEIVSILRMNYDSLPPNLKRCFAYCSIFPKDHEYDKEKLVLLWMAEGFLQHSKHRRIEEVGHEYFDDLISRSFFQKSGANGSCFVMHSRLHELAQLVSGEFCFSFFNDLNGKPSGRVRHLSLSVKSYQNLISNNTSHLRTLLLYYLPPGERSTDLSGLCFEGAKNWQWLRVLAFSRDTITKLPVSIGALKLLRYLDLSRTKISRLPKFVTTLYNLQTLLLSYCHLISRLPKKFRKLVYLRHLDIRETCLEEMPAKMGCLTSLQSLSDFVVGKYSGSNIRELGPLKHLQGTLCISRLQNVTSARDASEANLKDKADLNVLELKWSDATANSQHATYVLAKLEPHQNLEKLSIISYNGISFPDWVGDSSFSKMVFLHLSDCNSCSQLPPLGRLPSLKELMIEGMRGVKKIGPEFFGVNNVSANPFPSLEILVFREMPEWEGWIASEMQPVEFPLLKRMSIKSCPKYDQSHLCLPPTALVEISVSEETAMLPTKETVTVEKQLHEGDKVQVKKLLEVEEPQLPGRTVLQETDVSIASNRQTQGSLQPPTEDEKGKNVSTMEIDKGSVSLMAGENLSEETMAPASILQQLHGRISSPYISEFFGELKLDPGLLDNLKSNLLSLEAILDDAEFNAYKDEEVRDGFGDLKAVSSDLADLLNEIASKRERHQLKSKRWNIKTWVQRIFSRNIRDPNIRDRLEEINTCITRHLDTAKGAAENSSAATQIIADADTDDPINDESDMMQFRGNKKLLDRPSTSRPPEELQLPASNVVQRTMTSYGPAPVPPNCSTHDSGDMHGRASGRSLSATENLLNADYLTKSQEDTSSPEQESLTAEHGEASNNSLPAIGTREHNGDSQSSPELESMNVSQFSQLESLPQMLYSLEIEACDALLSLPADLNKLNKLRHLYIINCQLLKSIQASHLPETLKSLYVRKCKEVEFLSTAERYNFLENLCIESSCDSLESFPLAIFPQLKSLSIWDCANFNSLLITEDHMFLDALEIKNCAKFISFPEEELHIPKITSILLSNCKNLKVLPGQLHRLRSLQSLFINECPEVESVPKGGLPSCLNLVCISFCDKLTPCIQWGLLELNELSRIEIEDGSKDLESFPEQKLLPRKLISLRISRLPNLKGLDYKGLQPLTSLRTLKINSCNKLHSLPDEGLPSSLSYLYISDCPLLSSELQNRRGKEWLKIAHIPHIQIDGKVIS